MTNGSESVKPYSFATGTVCDVVERHCVYHVAEKSNGNVSVHRIMYILNIAIH